MANIDWSQFTKAPQAAPAGQSAQSQQIDWGQFTSKAPQQAESNPVASAATSAVGGLAEGTVDAITSAGELARNILLGGKDESTYTDARDKAVIAGMNYIRDKWRNVEDLRNQPTAYEQQAQAAHPVLHALGQGTGNVITTLGMANAASAPLQGPSAALTEAALPKAIQGPVLNTGVNFGLQGAAAGALTTPDHPVQGAIQGGITGGLTGLAFGAVAKKLNRASDILDFEKQNLQEAGVDPYSVEGKTRIQEQLGKNGIDYSKNQVQQQITNNIAAKIKDIDPTQNMNALPADRLTALAQANYKQTAQEVKIASQEFRDLPNQFQATELQKTIDNASSSLKKVMPDVLPENPTFNDMWSYRQDMDKTISLLTAKVNAKNATTLEYKQLDGLLNARESITNDMLNAADSLGMKDKFTALMDLYKTKLMPFNSFVTKSGKLLTPEDANDAVVRLNKLMMARSSNLNDMKNIADSLGPNGKDLMGQAMLQRVFEQSKDAKGLVTPNTYFTMLKKYKLSGAESHIWGESTQNAARGIQRILDGAGESLKIGSPQDITTFYEKIRGLLGSPVGRSLIEMVGSAKTPKATVSNLVPKIIKGTLNMAPGVAAMGAAKASENKNK